VGAGFKPLSVLGIHGQAFAGGMTLYSHACLVASSSYALGGITVSRGLKSRSNQDASCASGLHQANGEKCEDLRHVPRPFGKQ